MNKSTTKPTPTQCTVADCPRPRKNFTSPYCKTHYERVRKHGDPQVHIPIVTGTPLGSVICSDDDCHRVAVHTGIRAGHPPFCPVHYQKKVRLSPKDSCECGNPKLARSEYCRPCYFKHRTGVNHPNWKGGGRFLQYSLSQSEYNAKVTRQKGFCESCEGLEPVFVNGKRKELSLDHDHSCCALGESCGECVRDLLCSTCNHIIGFADDSVPLLLACVAYLMKWDRGTRTKEAIAWAHEIIDRYETGASI